MSGSVQEIPIANLAASFAPVLLVVYIIYRWSLECRVTLHAIARMLVQLVLIGYVLTYLFQSDSAYVAVAVLTVMLFASSWIALRPVKGSQREHYGKALCSIALGGVATLLLVTQCVLSLQPWFWPRYVIPLAGMIFANSMNTVSLAAERFQAEAAKDAPYVDARRTALRASLIPLTNSLFAVGLVSFPGMMTGQILSGVSPLVAARYQIMVMCMIFGSAGVSSACYLWLLRPQMSGRTPTDHGSCPA